MIARGLHVAGKRKGSSLPPNSVAASWVVTVAMGVVALTVRLVNIGRVSELLFDETYYVKDAWSLRSLGYEGTWAPNSDAAFASGSTTGKMWGLSPEGAFVVHPPLGKWLIASGMGFFAQDNPLGWRLSSILAGTITVVLLCRFVWILSSSTVATLLAGLFLATDGLHVVMSRIAILDVFLTLFVMAAFVAIAKDKGLGTHRPWLWVAGVLLGCACAIKWSGIYALATLGLYVVARQMVSWRRQKGPWVGRSIYPDGLLAFVALVGSALTTYLLSWLSWFFHPKAWGHPNLLRYHREVLSFHAALDADHPYRSHPWTWLFQLRPTAFWYEENDGIASFITALGNPLLWWFGFVALVLLIAVFFRYRTWQAGLILVGYLATYLPWFLFPNRTMFTFYAVTVAPFVCVVSAVVLAWMLGALPKSSTRNIYETSSKATKILLGSFALALIFMIIATATFFSPLWTGAPISENMFQNRMWLKSWI